MDAEGLAILGAALGAFAAGISLSNLARLFERRRRSDAETMKQETIQYLVQTLSVLSETVGLLDKRIEALEAWRERLRLDDWQKAAEWQRAHQAHLSDKPPETTA